MKKYQFVYNINNNKARRELSKLSHKQEMSYYISRKFKPGDVVYDIQKEEYFLVVSIPNRGDWYAIRKDYIPKKYIII